jgi:hypothetical protein
MRSFAAEGTVFWLIVSAVFGAIFSYYPGSSFWVIGIVVGLLQFVVAYFCWQQKVVGFLVTAALGFIFLLLNITISRLEYNGDEFLAMIQVLLVLFSLRAYREIRRGESSSNPA